MTRRLDKVDTGVHTVIHDIHSVDLVLSVEVGVESLLDVLNNGSPRVIVVDKVAEAGCIDHCET